MKTVKVALYAHAILLAALGSAHATTSHTFLRPRPLSNNNTIELSLSNYHLYHNNYDHKLYTKPELRAQISMQATDLAAHMHSMHLTDYFLWDNKREISIREDGSGDIGSVWLGLITPERAYNSSLHLKPWRDVVASIFTYHHDLSSLKEGLWVSLLLPVVDVRHGISFEEWVQGPFGVAENSYGDALTTAISALNSRDMQYGRVSYHRRSKSGLDDTTIKVGMQLHECEKGHLGVYADVLLPTSPKPKARHLFEPVIGNGGHFGLGLGLNFDALLYNTGKEKWSVQSDLKVRYLLPSTEKRSFDLKNGPWSRYLLVAHEDDPNVFALTIYELETMTVVESLPVGFFVEEGGAHTRPITGLAFNQDGAVLVTTSEDALAIVWDTTTWEVSQTLEGHDASVSNAAFDPVRNELATASIDGTVKIWNLDTGAARLTLPGGPFTDVSYSSDGRYLAAATDHGEVQVFMIDLDELVAESESRLTRVFTDAECIQYLHLAECSGP